MNSFESNVYSSLYDIEQEFFQEIERLENLISYLSEVEYEETYNKLQLYMLYNSRLGEIISAIGAPAVFPLKAR